MQSSEHEIDILKLRVNSETYSKCLITMGIDLDCSVTKVAVIRELSLIHYLQDNNGNHDIPVAIYLRDNRMEFGLSALNMMETEPEFVYLQLPCLIGKDIESEEAVRYRTSFPYHALESDKYGKVAVINNKQDSKYIEELLAIYINAIYRLANQRIVKTIQLLSRKVLVYTDTFAAVFTIPSYYKQQEKLKFMKVCQIANVTVLKLLEYNHAGFVALSMRHLVYKSQKGIYGIVYVGSSSIEMSLATISNYQDHYRNFDYRSKNISMISTSYLSLKGTLDIINILKQHFMADISKIAATLNVTVSNQVHARLYRAILEFIKLLKYTKTPSVTISHLFSKIDYSLTISYSDLSIILSSFVSEIREFFKSSFRNLPKFWILPKAVAITGEGKYFPLLVDAIKSGLKKISIINVLDPTTDLAFGSVIMATKYISGLFLPCPTLHDNSINVVTMMISMKNKLLKRNIKLKAEKLGFSFNEFLKNVNDDFNFTIKYHMLATLSKQYSITGTHEYFTLHKVIVKKVKRSIANVLQMSNDSSIKFKGIRISYKIDKNSIIKFRRIFALFMSVRKENRSGLSESMKVNSSKEVFINDAIFSISKEALSYEIDNFNRETVNIKDIRRNRNKIITKIKKIDNDYKKKVAHNELQFYLNDFKRKFKDEDYISCTINLERRVIWSFLEETTRWIAHSFKLSTYEEYLQRLDRLIELTEKVDLRVQEKRVRPILVKKMKGLLETTQQFIIQMFMTSGSSRLSKNIFTKNETKDLRKLNKDIKIWFINFTETINNTMDYDDPAILCEELIERIKILEKQHKQLMDLWERRIDPNSEENQERNKGGSLIEDSSKNKTSCENDTGNGTCSLDGMSSSTVFNSTDVNATNPLVSNHSSEALQNLTSSNHTSIVDCISSPDSKESCPADPFPKEESANPDS